MNHEACLPSLTDSTVVLATPARSPPHQILCSEVAMVSGSTSGSPHLLNLTGDMAAMTERGREGEREREGGREVGEGEREDTTGWAHSYSC